MRVLLRPQQTYDIGIVGLLRTGATIDIIKDDNEGMLFDMSPPVDLPAQDARKWVRTAVRTAQACGLRAVLHKEVTH